MNKKGVQTYIQEWIDQFEKGKLTRRGFLRSAARSGMSVTAASSFIWEPSFRNSGNAHADPVEGDLVKTRNEILQIYQEQNLKIFWGDIH